jgi:hypothetical protein
MNRDTIEAEEMNMAKSKINIGDTVRLTAKHLRATGQVRGHAAQDRFVVTGFERDWAITNQELSATNLSMFTAEELAADPSLRFRRIALSNLEAV